MIRMGRKYIIDSFFRNGMDRIDHDYPANLDKYRGLEEPSHIDDNSDVVFQVVNLLEELGQEYIHPSALYIACQSDIDVICGGIEANDTTYAILTPTC